MIIQNLAEKSRYINSGSFEINDTNSGETFSVFVHEECDGL